MSILTQGSTELPLSAYSPGAVIISLDASTTPAEFLQEVRLSFSGIGICRMCDHVSQPLTVLVTTGR